MLLVCGELWCWEGGRYESHNAACPRRRAKSSESLWMLPNLDLPHLNASALPRAKHMTSCHVSSSELFIQVVALAHPKFH